ncbi:MAG: demethoxyubiquinone hydroxylase family protein [Proteobacteria bacterium]|nr:demethoxyubiquinone hydroxylase family protein [Pseudomonadota bacterium]
MPTPAGPSESAPETTPQAAETGRRLPGDLTPAALVERVIRVDHAGEYGAKRIYEGQLAVLGRKNEGHVIRHMLEQELKHLDAFEKLMVERRARPSLLFPVWHVAGFALGAATALMGPKAAMACTVAVEEVIDEHYRQQMTDLGSTEPALTEKIEVFRAEEVEHRDTGLAHGAEQAPAYEMLSGAIKAGSRLAIWLAERF